MLHHLESHKRKYVAFFAVSLLAVYATFFVLTSEAQSAPNNQAGWTVMMGDSSARYCPPVFRRLSRHVLSFFPACILSPIRPQVTTTSVPEAPVIPEATSTPVDATSTASSTEEVVTPVATSTDETSSSTETTTSDITTTVTVE